MHLSSTPSTPSTDKNGFTEEEKETREQTLNSFSSSVVSRQHSSTSSGGHSHIEKNLTAGQFRESNSNVSLASHLEETIGSKVERIANSRLFNSTGIVNGVLSKTSDQFLEHQLVSDGETQQVRDRNERDRIFQIERTNLVNLLKLVNKALIESCINSNRMIDYDQNEILHHFFHILEQIFKHALKSQYHFNHISHLTRTINSQMIFSGKKGLLFGKKELWFLFEALEPFIVSLKDLINSVRELPHIK